MAGLDSGDGGGGGGNSDGRAGRMASLTDSSRGAFRRSTTESAWMTRSPVPPLSTKRSVSRTTMHKRMHSSSDESRHERRRSARIAIERRREHGRKHGAHEPVIHDGTCSVLSSGNAAALGAAAVVYVRGAIELPLETNGREGRMGQSASPSKYGWACQEDHQAISRERRYCRLCPELRPSLYPAIRCPGCAAIAKPLWHGSADGPFVECCQEWPSRGTREPARA